MIRRAKSRRLTAGYESLEKDCTIRSFWPAKYDSTPIEISSFSSDRLPELRTTEFGLNECFATLNLRRRVTKFQSLLTITYVVSVPLVHRILQEGIVKTNVVTAT